jgi:hypothetical protein
MNDFRKRMLLTAVIAGLAVIGYLMNSQQAVAQNQQGEAVTINPAQLPLPVKGSLGVSGTIAATQSGAWNVGITGTPNFNVVNQATAPVLIRDVDNPGRHPFRASCQPSSTFQCQIQVPATAKAIIQYVNANVVTTGSATPPTYLRLNSSAGDNYLPFTLLSCDVTGCTYVSQGPVTLNLDQGDTLFVTFNFPSGAPHFTATAFFNGYIVTP